jgi:hypothetical protein
MKMFAARLFALFVISMTVATIARDQVSTTRDGNWWLRQDELMKASYITGFFDGIGLGHNFSYWGYKDEYKTNPDAASAMAKTVASFDEYSQKYLNTVTSGQLADGLDKLYADYRNRSIKVSNGTWLVLNSIAGKSDAEMEKMIESYRKSVSK